MDRLDEVDAGVVESLHEAFEGMGDFHAESSGSVVEVDVPEESTFHTELRGQYMDWGFRLALGLRDAVPPGYESTVESFSTEPYDHSRPRAEVTVAEFTPYARRLVDELVRTWADVGVEQFPRPPGEEYVTAYVQAVLDGDVHLNLNVRTGVRDDADVLYHLRHDDSSVKRRF